MLHRLISKNVPSIDVSAVDTSDTNLVFLDAREYNEYSVSHIEGARFVGYKSVDLMEVLMLPKSTDIIVYCSVGYRSSKIAKTLIENGFTNVKNLYGGIFEWSNQDLPLVDMDDAPTKKIHAYSKKWGKWVTTEEKEYD